MMLSLPLITPRHDPTIWPSALSNPPIEPPSDRDPNNAASHTHTQRRCRSNSHSRNQSSTRTLLNQLTIDENQVQQRKQNVRRFGAGWIRPPGVLKTYQATMDEAAEREEHEAESRRQQVLLDMQAQQDEATRQGNGEWDGEGEEQRDLDDEVPDAVDEDSELSADEEDESALGGDVTGDVTFNEGSFIEGSLVEAQVEQMLEMEEAEMVGVRMEERDLDDDIPEAGSYQHTDTELEDSSDLDDSMGPSTGRRSIRRSMGSSIGGRRISGRPTSSGAPQRVPPGRSSFLNEGSSSLLGGSSFLESLPAAAATASRGQSEQSSNFRDRLTGPRQPRGV